MYTRNDFFAKEKKVWQYGEVISTYTSNMAPPDTLTGDMDTNSCPFIKGAEKSPDFDCLYTAPYRMPPRWDSEISEIATILRWENDFVSLLDIPWESVDIMREASKRRRLAIDGGSRNVLEERFLYLVDQLPAEYFTFKRDNFDRIVAMLDTIQKDIFWNPNEKINLHKAKINLLRKITRIVLRSAQIDPSLFSDDSILSIAGGRNDPKDPEPRLCINTPFSNMSATEYTLRKSGNVKHTTITAEKLDQGPLWFWEFWKK